MLCDHLIGKHRFVPTQSVPSLDSDIMLRVHAKTHQDSMCCNRLLERLRKIGSSNADSKKGPAAEP
jgi:hypothetical protein